MEEKLKEILSNYGEQIERYESIIETLESKMNFCKEHKFEEEYRISNVEYQALHMAIYRWRNMHKDLTEMLNAWNS